MTEIWQKSRCDDGSMMIHTEGDVMAFVDTNKGSPEDEATADRIVTAVNAYDKQRALIETLVDALKLFVRAEKMARDGNPPQDADKLIEIGDAALSAAKEITQ